MKYKTRTTNSSKQADVTALTFVELLNTAWEITPNPVKEIECGMTAYKSICEYAKSITKNGDSIGKDVLVGELYGVKIKIDPMLKPNEYRIVTASKPDHD